MLSNNSYLKNIVVFPFIIVMMILIDQTLSQPCHFSCSTCAGTTQSDCLTCPATRNITGSQCPCDDGYHDLISSPTCTQIICDRTCFTCNNTDTHCLTCNAAHHRIQVGSTCPCDAKYFDDGSAACASCHYSCETCSTTSTNCLSCNAASHRTQSSNTCVCNALYFDDSSNQLCGDCDHKCATCSGSALNCDTCAANRGSAPSCACLDRFYDDGGTPACQACQYSCLTCNSLGSCQTCDAATNKRGLSNSGFCACLPRFFQASVSAISCTSCHPTCLTCSGATVSQCLSCNLTAFRQLSTSTCQCKDGYYQTVSTTQLCIVCDHTCLTCNAAGSSACLTCDSSLNRGFLSNTCPCLSGYYSDSNQVCKLCHQSCLACANGNSCSSCPAGSQRTVGGPYNLCVCNTGFYDVGVQTCASCHYSCKTCENSTTTCMSCPTSSFRTLHGDTCGCNTHYFDNNVATCVVCHYSCQNCSGSGAIACTTCNAADFRTLNTGNNSCACQEGYYDDSSSSLCKTCHYTCKTCTGGAGSSNCATCESLEYRTKSVNSCPCNAGFFNNATNAICLSCSYKCATCVTSSTNCQTCAGNRITNPTCGCPTKFYDNFISATCPGCHYSCQTCTNGTNCLTCNAANNRQLSTNTTYCACKIRFYEATANTQMCTACHATCVTCSGTTASTCLSCNATAFRNLSTTTCACINGYYSTAATTELCAICHKSCLTCTGGTASNCASCDASKLREDPALTGTCTCMAGYSQDTLLNCVICHKNCQTCNNSTGCLTCPPTSNRATGGALNLCLCTTGFYDIGNVTCLACHYSCATCQTTASTCLTCPTSSFRTLFNSTCPCNTKYYDNSVAICVACDYTCQTCTNATACKTCNLLANHRKLTGAGACVCDTGFYDNSPNQLCGTCMYQCLTCSLATTCDTCQAAFHRTKTIDRCPCDQYFFDDLSNGLCGSCDYYCNTCTNASACLTCDSATHFRTINASTAQCDCMPKYFDTGIFSQTCASCLYSCATCLTNATCQTCDDTIFRTLNAAKLCVCMSGYYQPMANTAACSKCPYNCLTCSNSSGTVRCLTCDATKFRISNTSTFTCDCMTGYYDDGLSNMQCLRCNYTCRTCTGIPACTSCDNTLRTFSSPNCNCFAKYYDNGVTMACSLCDHSCATCDDAVSCLTCNATAKRVSSPNFCICQDKFYDNGISEQCATCNYKCKTCTNSSSCQTCDGTKFRSTPASSCPCMTRYFDTGLSAQLCASCHYTCKTCTNNSKCVSCEATKFRTYVALTKTCNCNDGYFDTGLSVQACEICDYRCLTCQTTQFTCLTCNASHFRTFDSLNAKCPCNQRFYDAAVKICQACDHSCDTCSDGVSCDTCNGSKFRIHNVTTDLCSPMIGYYDDHVNQLAIRCHLSCKTCLNSTHCDTCDAARFRMKNQSLNVFGISNTYCPCFYRYYDPNPNLDCVPCHYSCQVCSGANSNQCQYCNATAHRTLNPTTGKCLCNNNYYDDGNIEQCQNCHYLCSQCYDNLNTTCKACYNTYYLMVATDTCYVTCPDYFYNNTAIMQCSACSQFCTRCTDQDFCLQCETGKFLFLNTSSHFCLVICPLGTYQNATAKQCIYCPLGCASCTTNFDCQTCIDGYFLDIPLKLCYPCNNLCKTCTGPSQDQCSSCNYPLYYKNSKCYNLTCLFGQYVHPINGCTNCSVTFLNSLTCDINQALSCANTYHLIGGVCVQCNQVTGYQLTSTGTCREICGDGIKIEFQCDDGNTLDGDGCSSSCTVQKGWACNANSICTLTQIVKFELKQVFKYGGQNRVRLYFILSLPIRLSKSFVLLIDTINTSLYQYKWQQDQDDLTKVFLFLNYQTDINSKKIQISYVESRLLQRLQSAEFQDNQNQLHILSQNNKRIMMEETRNLLQLSINLNFTLQSFPPAIYYSDTQITQFNGLKSSILYLSIALLALCLILVPKRMHLHAITLFWIPTYIYMAFGITLQSQTDWVKAILLDIKYPALVYGVSLGNCCTSSTFFQFSSQLALTSGLVIAILIAFWIIWILLLFIDSLCCKIPRVLIYVKYHLLTLHAFILFHLVYTSIHSLYHFSIATQFDAINITVGILVLVYFIAFISLMLDFTYATKFKLQKTDFQSNATHGSQVNSDVQSRFYAVKSQSSDHQGDVTSLVLQKYQPKAFEEILNYESPKKNKQKDELDPLDVEQKSYQNTRDLKTADPNHKKQIPEENLVNIEDIEQNVTTDFPFDYSTLYSAKNPKSKFFLPVYLTKLWISAFICVVIRSYPLAIYSILIAIQVVFIGFLVTIKPFIYKFTTVRLVILSILLIALDSMFLVYALEAQKDVYVPILQVIMIYGIVALLAFAIFSIIIQHILAWRKQIWAKIESCLIYFRLRGSRRVYDMHKRQKEIIPVEEVEAMQHEQMDAFYARMIKKNIVNNEYRKQRHMNPQNIARNRLD